MDRPNLSDGSGVIVEIDDWRRQIDEIDAQLVHLLNRRSVCAIEIGKLKRRQKIDIFSPEREEEIITQTLERNQGPLDEAAIRRLFASIIEESRRLEMQAAEALVDPLTDEG